MLSSFYEEMIMAKQDADETTTDLTILGSDDSTGSPTLVEITTYIREDQAFALEILENAERQTAGKDFDRAKLIQEALDLLIEKHIVIVDLRKNRFFKEGG
jgi:hypothetical protein